MGEEDFARKTRKLFHIFRLQRIQSHPKTLIDTQFDASNIKLCGPILNLRGTIFKKVQRHAVLFLPAMQFDTNSAFLRDYTRFFGLFISKLNTSFSAC